MTEVETLILEVKTNGLTEVNKGLQGVSVEAQKAQAEFNKMAEAEKRAAVVINDYADARKKAAVSDQEHASAMKAWQEAQRASSGEDLGPIGTPNREAVLRMAELEKTFAVELTAEEEKQNGLLSQRTAIRELELEAVEAEAAQEHAKAELYTREIAIREQALKLQASMEISEEESLVLAERTVIAEEVIVETKQAQAALNAKLIAEKQEEIALAKLEYELQAALNRQLVEEEALRLKASTHKVAGRGGEASYLLKDIGVDAGLATSIGIGVIVADQLLGVVHGIAKGWDDVRKETEKETAELNKQTGSWNQSALLAQSMGDVAKLTEQATTKIADLEDKLNALPDVSPDKFKWLRDVVGSNTTGLRDSTGYGPLDFFRQWDKGVNDFEKSTDRAKRKLQEQIDAFWAAKVAAVETAKSMADAWKDLGHQSVDDQISKLGSSRTELKAHQAEIDTTNTAGAKAWLDDEKRIEQVTKALEKAQATREKYADQSTKLAEDFDTARRGDKSDKLAETQAKILEIKSVLDELTGESVVSPSETMAGAKGIDEETVAIKKLAVEWQKLQNVVESEGQAEVDKISEANEKAGKEAEREAKKTEKAKEFVDHLQSQVAIEERLSKGDKDGAEALKRKYDLEKDLATIAKSELNDAQKQNAEIMANQLSTLKAQTDELKKQQEELKNLQQWRKGEAEFNASVAGPSKQAQRAGKLGVAVADERTKLEDAGISGDDLERKMAAFEKSESRKLLRADGRFGGSDARSSRDNLGSKPSLGESASASIQNDWNKEKRVKELRAIGADTTKTEAEHDKAFDEWVKLDHELHPQVRGKAPTPLASASPESDSFHKAFGKSDDSSVNSLPNSPTQHAKSIDDAAGKLSSTAQSLNNGANSINQVNNELQQFKNGLATMVNIVNGLVATVSQIQSTNY